MVVYCITNKINGKKYIGQTIDFERRMYQHSLATRYCRRLSNAIKKYGWENFTSEIIATASSYDELYSLEEKLIKEYNTITPNGYNLMKASSGRGVVSDETRSLLRKTNGGKNNGRYGKPVSQETREKISQQKKGIKMSTESRKNIREGHLGVGKINVSKEDIISLKDKRMKVVTICEKLGISRTTFYRRLND